MLLWHRIGVKVLLVIAGLLPAGAQPVAWVKFVGNGGVSGKTAGELLDMLSRLEGAPESLAEAIGKRRLHRFQQGTGKSRRLYTRSHAWATCLAAYRAAQRDAWDEAVQHVAQGGYHTKGDAWLGHALRPASASDHYLAVVKAKANRTGPNAPRGGLRRRIVNRCNALLGVNPVFDEQRFLSAWADALVAYYAAAAPDPVWDVCSDELNHCHP